VRRAATTLLNRRRGTEREGEGGVRRGRCHTEESGEGSDLGMPHNEGGPGGAETWGAVGMARSMGERGREAGWWAV
jgi:hypothetical protein